MRITRTRVSIGLAVAVAAAVAARIVLTARQLQRTADEDIAAFLDPDHRKE